MVQAADFWAVPSCLAAIAFYYKMLRIHFVTHNWILLLSERSRMKWVARRQELAGIANNLSALALWHSFTVQLG